jgi:hypothetical protein
MASAFQIIAAKNHHNRFQEIAASKKEALTPVLCQEIGTPTQMQHKSPGRHEGNANP